MNNIRARHAHFGLPFALGLLLVTLGTTCSSNQTGQPPTENSTMTAQSSPTPETEKAKSPDGATQPLTESDPALSHDEAWIVSTQNVVNLTPKATGVTVAVKPYAGFRLGDLLEVGEKSLATAVCGQGTCVLGKGNYYSCCTVPCLGGVSMIRRENASDLPLINRSELPAAEAKALSNAEKGLRDLNLPPVTTQFLVTTLYTNWRIKEANKELDTLTLQLATPEAKEEFKQLYGPAITKTGNMHLKYNRVEDAQKLYLLNLKSSTTAEDPRDRAAVHVGLAQTYELSGKKAEAITNLESARDIYVKQGDSKAAASTEKQIEKNREIRGVDTIQKTKPMMQKSP